MKLLIIRHGDPDYDRDSLTPKGWKEVEYLSERIAKLCPATSTVVGNSHALMPADRVQAPC